jgi:type I restriction enzyme S subunit
MPDFLFYYGTTYKARKYFMQRAKYTTMATIDQQDLKDFEVPNLPIPEQLGIIEILKTFDSAIEKTERIIWLKKERKDGLMQKILKGDGRYKKIKNKKEIQKLSGLIKEVSERNSEYKVNFVLSVSNTHGFRHQSEQFDRVVASKDLQNYKIVRKGQFGYNPSRVNVGSIARLEDFKEGILSPMYVIFETDETKLLPEYMKYFIQTWAFQGQVEYLTQGSVRDSLGFDSLKQMEIYLTSIQEQQKAVNLLGLVDNEIDLLNKKLALLKTQKKGLMQQLLTGKIRVKTNGDNKNAK